jgi:hypothetical protein
MKKICLVFTGSQYESWNKNGIIQKLNQNFKLEIYIVNPKEKFESLEENVKIVLVQDPGKVLKALYDINQIQNLDKSKSFVFRLKRMYFGPADIKNYSWNSFIFYKILILKAKTCIGFSIHNLVLTAALFRIFNRTVSNVLQVIYWNSISKSHKKTENIFKNSDAQLVIFPSTGVELQVFNMLAMAKILGKQTLITLENWDNLTSKSTLLFKPNYLTVMGPKMLKQAQNMYGFSENEIAITGLPRFEAINNYSREIRHSRLQTHSDKKFKILYLGFSLPYNEISTVNAIAKILEESKLIEDWSITYRPHPFRQKRFYEEKFLNTANNRILKDETHLETSRSRTKKLPMIQDAYISQLLSYDLIVATPTTMCLETILLKLPTIIDGCDDQSHITTPKRALRSYLHLEDLLEIESLKISHSPEAIVEHILDYLKSPPHMHPNTYKTIIQNNFSYSNQLIEFINKCN